MTNSIWCAVIVAGAALGLCGCDGIYFRRIEVTGPDVAAFTVDGPSTQVVLSTLRAYAVDYRISCPDSNQLPFECKRTPITVWALSTERGIAVCYYALGAALERRKFERYMDRLQEMLVNRFGAGSVTSVQQVCSSESNGSRRGTS
jgi:hypothetical protein